MKAQILSLAINIVSCFPWNDSFTVHFQENICQISKTVQVNFVSVICQVKVVSVKKIGNSKIAHYSSRQASYLLCNRSALWELPFPHATVCSESRFNNSSNSYSFGKSILTWSDVFSFFLSFFFSFFFFLLCVVVKNTIMTHTVWYHCWIVLRCWHNCFCTITADVNTMRKTDNILVLLWKCLWPHVPPERVSGISRSPRTYSYWLT